MPILPNTDIGNEAYRNKDIVPNKKNPTNNKINGSLKTPIKVANKSPIMNPNAKTTGAKYIGAFVSGYFLTKYPR